MGVISYRESEKKFPKEVILHLRTKEWVGTGGQTGKERMLQAEETYIDVL